MRALGVPKIGPFKAYRLALMLATLGVVVSLWADHTVREALVADARYARIQAAQERISSIQAQLPRTATAGGALSAFFEASDAVDSDQFSHFAAAQLKTDPFAQALSWAPVVPGAERSAFEVQAKSQGATGYAVTEVHPSGGRLTAPQRDSYVPVRFVEPAASNRLLGFDLSSDPARREALEQARDTGRARATAPLQLISAKGERGFDVVSPVYRGAPKTEAERREALVGYTVAEVSASALLSGALGSFRNLERPMRFELLDTSAPEGQQLLASTGATLGEDAELVADAIVSSAGRSWVVRAQSPPLPPARASVLPTGLALTALLVAYALVVLERKASVEREVSVRTAELRMATARARADAEQLAGLNEALRRRNGELDEFLFSATHDLQEPVRRVGLFAQLLERSMPAEEQERSARHLTGLRRAAERLRGQLRALHALAEITRSETDITRVRVDDCVDAALSGLNGAVSRSGARIDRIELPEVTGDARLLRRIYEELIDNAMRFTEKPNPHIALTAQRDGPRWVLGVKDDGVGVDEGKLEDIFAPFRQLKAGEEERPGIGLTVARRAVDRMGGQIWMESAPGGGAHVRFTVPSSAER